MTRQTLADVALIFISAAVAAAIVALGGCSIRPTMTLPSRTAVSVAYDPALSAQCERLDRAVVGFTVGTVAAGTIGASTGLTAMLADQSRWVSGGVSLGTTLASAVFGALENLYSARYTARCTAGATGSP